MEDIQWKVWKVLKASGGRYGRAHKGDIWECSNVGGLIRKNGVIQDTRINDGKIWPGYMFLVESGYKVHQIIAQTWCVNDDPKHKRFVDHIDGNRLNNDASNLRWVTNLENQNNPITRKRKSEGKLRYGKFKQEHKDNISSAGKLSISLMTDKQRVIRCNPRIKGIYLHFNKETNKYDYYDNRFYGNKLTEEEVNDILLKQGYDNNAKLIR